MKLRTTDRVIRCQPSTITKSRIFTGSDIITGGTISIPIDIRLLATTMSMIRKGTYSTKPSWKADFSSLMMKLGIST